MKPYLRLFVLVPALALGSGLCRGAPDMVAPDPVKGTVLILHTERTMEGDIQRKGPLYSIRRGPAEVTIPADRVLRLCLDWDDAFAFMKSRANLGDPDERLRLAKWCDINNLCEYALAEAEAALAMRPGHTESRQLKEIFRRRVESNRSGPTSTPDTVPNQPPAPQIDISPEALAQFTSKVQPILLNTCANCHSAGRGGDFQLSRPFEGGPRPAAQRNLAAVIAHVNVDRPALSPLLIKATIAHGNLAQPPIRSRQSIPYQTLHEWVESAIATNPQLREQQRWSPRALAAPAASYPEPTSTPRIGSPGARAPIESSGGLADRFGEETGGGRASSEAFASGQVISSYRPRDGQLERVSIVPQGTPSFPQEVGRQRPPEPPQANAQAVRPKAADPQLAGLAPAQFPDSAGHPRSGAPSPLTEAVPGLPMTKGIGAPAGLAMNLGQSPAFPAGVAAPQGVPAQAPAGLTPVQTVGSHLSTSRDAEPNRQTATDPFDPAIFNRQMHPQR